MSTKVDIFLWLTRRKRQRNIQTYLRHLMRIHMLEYIQIKIEVKIVLLLVLLITIVARLQPLVCCLSLGSPGHRTLYIGVHVPLGRKSHRRHRHHGHRHRKRSKERDSGVDDGHESPSHSTSHDHRDRESFEVPVGGPPNLSGR